MDENTFDDALPRFSAPVYANRVIQELAIDGRNAILPWGVEFADSSAFYSMEDGVGYRCEVLEVHDIVGPPGRESVQIVRMREGLVRLHLVERLEGPRQLRRTCTLTCLDNTTLMDFVLRFRFRAREFPRGYIAGRVLPFARTSVYHQFPVDCAAVSNDRYSVSVSVLGKSIPGAMKGHVYLSDGEDAWVLHVRMLPVEWSKEVIKLCSRWFGTRPLPQWASAPLLRIDVIRKALWYRGERRPWRNRFVCLLSPNAYPMVLLPKGEVLRWDVVCRIGLPLVAPAEHYQT